MVIITDRAVEAIKAAMVEENLTPENAYLRVGVKSGGCSGLLYDLSLEREKQEADLEIENTGVRLLIDVNSQLYLAGTTLDYTSGLHGKGFSFVNPNATGTCGCGESFGV